MAFTPTELFPSWYKIVDLNLDSETIKARLTAINKMVLLDDQLFWLNVAKLYLGVELAEKEKAKFVQYFINTDPLFPLEGNDNILRTLAAISLAFRLFTDESLTTYTISLGILNADFLRQFDLGDFSYVESYAIQNSTDSNLKLRVSNGIDVDKFDPLIEQLEDDETEETESINSIKTATLSLIDTVKQIKDQHSLLAEETNTLWWIYGEYSKTANTSFVKAGLIKMTLFAAIELERLTTFHCALTKSKEFIHKVLKTSNVRTFNTELSLYEFVNNFSLEEKKHITKYFKEDFIHFTPCVSAFKLSTELGKGEDWSGLYRSKLNDGNVKSKKLPIDISFQIYNELIFLYNI